MKVQLAGLQKAVFFFLIVSQVPETEFLSLIIVKKI